MANTDFFDDDLVKQRDSARRLKLGPSDDSIGTVGDGASSDEVPVRPVSDFNLTRMAKHKQEVDDHVATAVHELERLRKRQEDLEREKKELEELRRKQEEYERGKREMSERLSQSLVTLEKDELQAERVVVEQLVPHVRVEAGDERRDPGDVVLAVGHAGDEGGCAR